MNPRTVYTVLEEAALAFGDKPALQQPIGDGKYETYSWSKYRDAVREIAVGLESIGIEKGEIVALQSETRAEFYLADIGLIARGAIAAALYTSLPLEDQVKTLRGCDAKVAFAENPKTMAALSSAAGDQPLTVRWILLTGEASGVLSLEQVRQKGREQLAREPNAFDRIRSEVTELDHAILYMTSGATGEPKMGLVTQRALVANMDHGPAVLPLSPNDCTIAFLPSAHIAQRIVCELLPIREGACVYFSEGLSKMPSELRTVRPTFFLAPPRVWERIYATVSTEIRKRPAMTRRLFYTAIGLGSEAARRVQTGRPIPGWMKASLKTFDALVYSKIRERLGGRLRVAASGAAPLGKELAEFYAAIGMPLVEGYGLTECGVVSLNPLNRPKPGSIGKPLPGVEARIADDGELMLRSPCMFSGYYKDSAATAAVLRDGWLATGDIAEFDSDRYLYITGRKKELIVSSSGKKIYPARIEGLFKREPLINQVLLIGDKMPYVTALITINAAHAETIKGVDGKRSAADLAKADAVLEEVNRAVKQVNKQLASFEQIRRWKVLEKEFSIESGELTPTMKVRRNRVLENYRGVVSDLYLGKDAD
ncbi:MAG: long-chain fatty acid--CoA ligase [Bryobacteraceae bacterium]